MASLANCALELNRAMGCGYDDHTPHHQSFRCCSRQELALLQHDSAAQILSFYPLTSVSTPPGRLSPAIRHHTLSAVSPCLRLYAEAIVLFACSDTGFEGVQVSERELVYCIMLDGRAPGLQRLERSLWWSERCGLPVVLNAPNACHRLLTMLPTKWRQRVRCLGLLMQATSPRDSTDVVAEQEGAVQAERKIIKAGGMERARWAAGRRMSLRSLLSSDDTAPVRLSCASFLSALPTFSCLTRLAITGEYATHPESAATAVTGALRAAKGMPISEVELRLFKHLSTLRDLAGALCLERLTVHHSSITDVSGLASCPWLSFFDVSENGQLTDLSGLAGAPRLRELISFDCAISVIDGLSSCPLLSYADLSANSSLSSLHGLAGSPRLQELNLSRTAVSDLDVLRSCPMLVKVDVRACSNVLSIAPLAHLDVLTDVPQ
ncbi:hypothetical protein ABL78_7831 [Leptomonas seymouri]|uniref:Leucine-rich repeat protein (LRRP) n=1 Tax=Leptomonas seymouri TaxID=5684 RepID=A0A0N1I1E8_LEPSE|nr:hypothetical protein ABL78_7831 [Leptomonas seymouri]|eukprot:KPI83143.1 hypothetical protein ABL78_7831 [Leptomonas seymouri]